MATRMLAKQLDLIEVVSVTSKTRKKFSIQPFDYLIIIDFEATCWQSNDPQKCFPEIIEFPAVLYDVQLNRVLLEFQQYVMPVENPKLSEFCSSLTGITQFQVDNGVPLGTCLMLFKKWLNEITTKYNLVFPNNYYKVGHKCAFVTWSDWDLGTCLNNECRRKKINVPPLLFTWIDLRALYREHYHRRPNGLAGALSEVGLKFEGREHCGLHDAKNTAILIGRMVNDGILLRITKDNRP